MMNYYKWIILGIGASMLAFCSMVYAQEVPKEQLKGLDEQVQEIKSDTLAIAAELNSLEEKLLFPSNTQVAVFVSLVDGDNLRLDYIKIQMDGNEIANHIYTFKELEALRKGGVQRLYTGNIRSGAHDLLVSVGGKSTEGIEFMKTNQFTVHKKVRPGIVEIKLASNSIRFKER